MVISLRVDDESNFYTLVKDDKWFARIQLNGEFTVTQQEQFVLLMAAALDKREGLDQLFDDIRLELTNARTKFPGDNVTMLALMEELGELATATFEENSVRVRKEAIQVCVMAIRVILDGDATLDKWREDHNLDMLGETKRE